MKDLDWAKTYIESFAKGSDAVLAHWADGDDIVHEDPVLGQRTTNRAGVAATFDVYSNADRTNGIGIHTFRADEYFPGDRCGVTHWTWTAEDCAEFLGMPTNGATLVTTGVSVDFFDEEGKIVRELAYWDAVRVSEQLGGPLKKPTAG
ncbi:ester cyclase [Rhodococcus sp. B50]|uniref:ester cyclase n=1 Tax=Rhodococcus sp. B50 TaxID=2682847 RepID=UPI001BD6534F|nr:ester cyclase [Rhodococcus sp. B50]MBS9376505.1 hypothetical protein [Rhodococcus sp. B50]